MRHKISITRYIILTLSSRFKSFYSLTVMCVRLSTWLSICITLHFHTDSLKNKDTGFKYISPLKFFTRCATDSVSQLYYVFIEKKGMIYTDYDLTSALRLSLTLFFQTFFNYYISLGKETHKIPLNVKLERNIKQWDYKFTCTKQRKKPFE